MTSNQNESSRRKRPYTLRARARRREEVHRRITLAAVELHGTVGPAKTTVSDVARAAGVRRATVYNHFPTDADLFDACSTHWFAENPPPDPAAWAQIPDRARRVETALAAMYAYYDHGRGMLDHVLRDAPLVKALDELLQRTWSPLMDGIVEILAGGSADARVRGTLRVAIDFFTWQTLAESGLSNENAARLAAAWVDSATSSSTTART